MLNAFLFVILVSQGSVSSSKGDGLYLMLVPDTFYTSILPLADWRQRTGLEVKIVKLSEIDSNPTDTVIRDYLVNAYNTWTEPPKYVALVGDMQFLPAHTYSSKVIGDNQWYGNLDGNPGCEVMLGRISALTPEQLDSVVAQIIDYERFPYIDSTGWQKKATFVVCDPFHLWQARTTINKLIQCGFTIDTLFDSNGTATKENLVSCINEGRAFVFYFGHGGRFEWQGTSPRFKNEDVLNLTNGRKLPFVIACACRTGRYQYDECIGEAWSRRRATGYIGANRFTNTGTYKVPRDFIDVYCDSIYRLGQCATAGMDTILLYNMFGDPGMRIWGDVPDSITCTYKDTIPVGPHDFSVSVREAGNPASGVTVCLTSDIDSIFSAGKTDESGEVILHIDSASDTVMYVTVTSPFHIPHEGTVVISHAGISENETGKDFILSLNSSNPFTHSTAINYQLSDRSRVSLKVYDISGRMVKTLVDGEKEAGDHNVNFEAKGLGDGIYFLRFSAGDYKKTKKLILVR